MSREKFGTNAKGGEETVIQNATDFYEDAAPGIRKVTVSFPQHPVYPISKAESRPVSLAMMTCGNIVRMLEIEN